MKKVKMADLTKNSIFLVEKIEPIIAEIGPCFILNYQMTWSYLLICPTYNNSTLFMFSVLYIGKTPTVFNLHEFYHFWFSDTILFI